MHNHECRQCEGFLDIEHSRYCSECSVDICEGCLRLVEGLSEAYAHDDEADRLCDGCIAKFEGYRAAARLSLQSAGGAR